MGIQSKLEKSKIFRLRHSQNCMMRHVDDKGWSVAKPETKTDEMHSSNHVVFLGIRSFYLLWYFIEQFGSSRGSLIRSTWGIGGLTYICKMCEEWSKISWSSYMSANIKNRIQSHQFTSIDLKIGYLSKKEHIGMPRVVIIRHILLPNW